MSGRPDYPVGPQGCWAQFCRQVLLNQSILEILSSGSAFCRVGEGCVFISEAARQACLSVGRRRLLEVAPRPRHTESINGYQLGVPAHTAAWRAAECLRVDASTHFSGRSLGNGITQPAGSAPKPIKAHTHQEPALRPLPTRRRL